MSRLEAVCRGKLLFALIGILYSLPVHAQSWIVLGPEGGDARSFGYAPKNPDRILLGTATSTIFASDDGGLNWSRLARIGEGERDGDHDYVIDHIVMDPGNPDTIFVAAWSVQDRTSGDIFYSRDGGKSWKVSPGMHGKPVRALAMGPANLHLLVAGALDGVYVSTDDGGSWERISPADDDGLRNIESVAIDPKDPNVIYAGTWHLAWKTSDRGISWHKIDKGMIDDSDVFSIIVDASNSSVVFASACSGIYRSESAGDLFRKVQGIPFSARRTRILKQDPANPNVVYAGTTEGLWRTKDSGKTWKQLTDSDVVVNDIWVDPQNSSRLLLATDRAGVLASTDGGTTFISANHGYTHRHITAILPDQGNADAIYVGIAGDRKWGGVYRFQVASKSWSQRSEGLGGRDVLTMKQAGDGTMLAGTTQGLFLLNRGSASWRVADPPPGVKHTVSLKRVKSDIAPPPLAPDPNQWLTEAKVRDLDVTASLWLAATSEGLFASEDGGRSWRGGAVLGRKDFISVQSNGQLVVLATRSEILISSDGGMNWRVSPLPLKGVTIHGMVISRPDDYIFVASREGGFRSLDLGRSWHRMLNGLPEKNLSSISCEPGQRLILATSRDTGVVFQSEDQGLSWKRGPDTGYPLLQVRLAGDRLLGATPFDGLVTQP
jgi:photosystem II stability/assembly factor-like uncharacterized protein